MYPPTASGVLTLWINVYILSLSSCLDVLRQMNRPPVFLVLQKEIEEYNMMLNIVMVEPQIPQNTGNVARTCAATGSRLHLVGPMAFEPDDKKLKRAGLDYWHLLDITYYTDIFEFFDKVSNGLLRAAYENPGKEKNCKNDNCKNNSEYGNGIHKTCYPDTSAHEFYYFTTKAAHIYTEPNYGDNAYLFFGSETKGLDESLLYKNPEQCVRFPMLPDARSMNLSNTVAIGVFEVLRQWNFSGLQNYGKMAE